MKVKLYLQIMKKSFPLDPLISLLLIEFSQLIYTCYAFSRTRVLGESRSFSFATFFILNNLKEANKY